MKIFWKIVWALFILSNLVYSFYLQLEKQYDKANWYLMIFFIFFWSQNEINKQRKLEKKELEEQIKKDIERKYIANE